MTNISKEEQYRLAISLMQYHIQLLWLIFGAFLLAETVILASIASLINDNLYPHGLVLSIVGLVIVFPWWSSFRHNYSYYLLRIEQAKQLEDEGGLLKEGETLSEGKKVHCIKMPWSARNLPPRHGIRFLIIIFFCLYSLIIVGFLTCRI